MSRQTDTISVEVKSYYKQDKSFIPDAVFIFGGIAYKVKEFTDFLEESEMVVFYRDKNMIGHTHTFYWEDIQRIQREAVVVI